MYGPRLKGWLRSRFGDALQHAELDDALSVTAYNAWRFVGRFDAAKGPFEAWLIGIAGNAARSIVRGEQRHRAKHLEYDDDYDPAWVDERHPSFIGHPGCGMSPEQLSQLETAIAELPRLQKAVIEADLASNGHTDDGRLAEIHGTTKNSIQVSRHKAIKNLHQALLRVGYDPSGKEVAK